MMGSNDVKKSEDIKIYESNKEGDDFIIGDVHGCADCLEKVIDTLKKHDRLFIVGDLNDKGKNSLKAIELAIKHKDQVHVTRGNHEDICLDAINALEKHAFFCTYNASKEELTSVEEVKFHSDVGGAWFLDLFWSELESKEITITEKHLTYSDDSKVKQIKDFFSSLPYIIHVEGNEKAIPFYMVHADMPFGDEELEKRKGAKNLTLTSEEKNYATLARKDNEYPIRSEKYRTSDSILVYCGHEIVLYEQRPVVDRAVNTVDIDFAAYALDALLVVNHTKCNVSFCHANSEKSLFFNKYESFLNKLAANLHNHLQAQFQSYSVSRQSKSNVSIKENIHFTFSMRSRSMRSRQNDLTTLSSGTARQFIGLKK